MSSHITCLPRFHSAPCRSPSSSSQHSDQLDPPVKLQGGGPVDGLHWRPCSFTPIHSLTGLLGQLFVSCLGDKGSHPRDAPRIPWNWVLLLAMSRYSTIILHWGSDGSLVVTPDCETVVLGSKSSNIPSLQWTACP